MIQDDRYEFSSSQGSVNRDASSILKGGMNIALCLLVVAVLLAVASMIYLEYKDRSLPSQSPVLNEVRR